MKSRIKKEYPPCDDIVRVECSPYAMVNWALQYSDRVEVVEPAEVRDAIIEKVRNLNSKYGSFPMGKN
ncbi:MAG: WYL domain-containing protein [Oscillospiraceae bacterium]